MAVRRAMQSGWLTSGALCDEFERRFADACGVKHAVAVSSATAGLHLALVSAEFGKDDVLCVSPYTFVASAAVALHIGMRVQFVDIERDGYNIDCDLLERAVGNIRGASPARTRIAIMPVHIGGLACDMTRIRAIARTHKCYVIEDAAHCQPLIGEGASVGARGDCAVFSFYATKPITTAEGGMIITDNHRHAKRMRLLRNHGMSASLWERMGDGRTDDDGQTRDRQTHDDGQKRGGEQTHGGQKRGGEQTRDGQTRGDGQKQGGQKRGGEQTQGAQTQWAYDIQAHGYKYNLPDPLAAIGTVQLRRAQSHWRARAAIAAYYHSRLLSCPWIEPPPMPPPDRAQSHAWHLFLCQLRLSALNIDRDRFIALMRANGVQCSVHYVPLHLTTAYKSQYRYRASDFPRAAARYRAEISLPLYPQLTMRMRARVVRTIDAIGRAHTSRSALFCGIRRQKPRIPY